MYNNSERASDDSNDDGNDDVGYHLDYVVN